MPPYGAEFYSPRITARVIIPTGDKRGMENGQEGDLRNFRLFLDENPNPVRGIPRGQPPVREPGSWLLMEHWKTQSAVTCQANGRKSSGGALDNRREQEVEVRIGIKTILLQVVPICDREYANLYGMDVTHRRHVEEKLRLNAQVLENTAGRSHDHGHRVPHPGDQQGLLLHHRVRAG